jgi:hypothetical protein
MKMQKQHTVRLSDGTRISIELAVKCLSYGIEIKDDTTFEDLAHAIVSHEMECSAMGRE